MTAHCCRYPCEPSGPRLCETRRDARLRFHEIQVRRLNRKECPPIIQRMSWVHPSSVDLPVDMSVVLPCLDEETTIGGVIEEAWEGIATTGLRAEMIVVDNGSTDDSVRIAVEHGARVIHEARRGYGSAYLAGLARARGEYIVMADSDGTYDLTKMKPFIDLLQAGSDLVLGSRFKGTIQPGAMPWMHRWIGNPLLTALLNLLFGVRVSDAHCGLRCVKRSVLPRLNLSAIGMEFASEMVFKAKTAGLKIAEVPIEYRTRAGESKLSSLRDGWRHLRLMLVYSSTALFVVPGVLLTTLGLAALLLLAGGPVQVFGREWGIVTMVVAAGSTLVGTQLMQLGVFARSYAILYLGEHEPLLERLWLRFRLEHGLLFGTVLFGAGLLIVLGLGSSTPVMSRGNHMGLLGLTLIGLGVQTGFGSFFLSILGLRKHLLVKRNGTADATPSDERLDVGDASGPEDRVRAMPR